eukprot:3487805-Rhodomonas_salina.1
MLSWRVEPDFATNEQLSPAALTREGRLLVDSVNHQPETARNEGAVLLRHLDTAQRRREWRENQTLEALERLAVLMSICSLQILRTAGPQQASAARLKIFNGSDALKQLSPARKSRFK